MVEQLATKTWPSGWHLWRWAYARLYIRHRRRYGQRDQPKWAAVCQVSALMGANLLSMAAVVCWAVGAHWIESEVGLRKLKLVGLACILLYFNYRRFMRKGAADELIRKFEQQRRRETHRDEVRLLWYVLGSLAAPVVLGLIGLYFHLGWF